MNGKIGVSRDRTRDLTTLELGSRTDLDIRRTLERQIETERWTQLERQRMRDGRRTGIIDLAPQTGISPTKYTRGRSDARASWRRWASLNKSGQAT